MAQFGRFRTFLRRIAFAIAPDLRDGAHWSGLSRRPLGTTDPQDPAQTYTDALQAYERNPYAKRIIDLITDYTIGDVFMRMGR